MVKLKKISKQTALDSFAKCLDDIGMNVDEFRPFIDIPPRYHVNLANPQIVQKTAITEVAPARIKICLRFIKRKLLQK